MSGDTLWEGKVNLSDTITLNKQFELSQTSHTYFTLDGGYREFDWAVEILIGFYHQNLDGELIPFWGNIDPLAPKANPTYAFIYINTKTADTYFKINHRHK